jgi:tetratricopeptide (TPR) repeat protein
VIRAGFIALLSASVLAVASALSRAPARDTAGAELIQIRDADIEFYERRVAADPQGAMDRMRLGGLLLERARYTGAEHELERAESLARESLALRTAHNAAAWRLLASALLGQHRFVEALAAAEELIAADPDAIGARAMRGEILLELGRYISADSVFGALAVRRTDPAVGTRYARWMEIRGRAGEARALLERARRDAEEGGAPLDHLAWFDLRLGELAFRYGNFSLAREYLAQGLRAFPSDWRLLALAARIELAESRPSRAVAFGDSSLAVHMDPSTLATVGDAWLELGDSVQAESYFKALESAAGSAPRGGFHRAWYLALLDHDRRVPEVLEAVKRDLASRSDVYGWDLLAWALHKSGRSADARVAIVRALASGTRDPLVMAHARAILEAP